MLDSTRPSFGALTALLVAGGDERLLLDPTTGLNKYECSPSPRGAAVELGSCTGSSISPLAFEAAWEVFARLRRAETQGQLSSAAAREYECNRAELLSVLGLDGLPGVTAVFTPSGTDAELVPLALVAGRARRRICTIVVGPGEAGSGTALAARGCHPNELTPLGARGDRAPLGGGLSARIVEREVAVRDDDGTLRSGDALDRDVEALTEQAIKDGDHVILHRMSHSKTGVFAPSLDCIETLTARHGERVTVVVDAAQGRIGPSALVRHLGSGHFVMFTGSKFYGGPPFSGAVLVPNSACPAKDLDVPAGLGDYLSAADVPPAWRAVRGACSRPHNLGLLLRWTAALAEIRAYRAIAEPVRREIIAAFGASVRARLSASRRVTVLPTPRIDTGARTSESAPEEDMPTVFSFSLRAGKDAAGRALGVRELRRLAHGLGVDASSAASGSSSATLRRRFHVGQPVALGRSGADTPAVLRIALGAPLVRSLVLDPQHGLTLPARLASLDVELTALSTKLDVLVDAEATRAAS